MSVTPNRGLPLMESSQAQPEVDFNLAMNILDEGTSLEVEESGDSPGVLAVTKLKFVGATVAGADGVATVTIDASSGGGGGGSPLTVNSETNVTTITFEGPAVSVAPGATGEAVVTIDTVSGGSGGGSAPLTPDTHPFSPDALDDEGEGTINTLNAKWTWYNQGSATAVYDGQGAIKISAPLTSGVSCRFIGQPISGSAWRIRAPVIIGMSATAHNAGLLAYESATGKVMRMTVYDNSGTPTWQITGLTSLTGSGVSTSSGSLTGFPILLNALQQIYMELELASGVLYGRFSTSGYDGTFVELGNCAVSSVFTTAPDTVGLFIESQNGSTGNSAWIDWFRRMA